MSRVKDGLLKSQIIMPEQSRRPAQLQGFMTIEGAFRLVINVGDEAHHVDLTPQQTIEMATGMLRAVGIEINFAGAS